MKDMLLKVNEIDTYYGTFQALRNVSLEVNAGEIVTILGANGTGKSTLLKTMAACKTWNFAVSRRKNAF